MSYCETRKYHPCKYMIGHILAFFQSGLEMKLSTIKDQISALAVFFPETKCSSLIGMHFCSGGVTCIALPVNSPLCQ